ncbi:MAG: hypothetical protein ACP5LQ_03025 [Candidatus Methanodesulfokora sp.]
MDSALTLLRELAELGLLDLASVSRDLELAKDLIAELNLYASDAISSALMESLDIKRMSISCDDVREYSYKRGVRILRLKEYKLEL